MRHATFVFVFDVIATDAGLVPPSGGGSSDTPSFSGRSSGILFSLSSCFCEFTSEDSSFRLAITERGTLIHSFCVCLLNQSVSEA